ncbi:MAG: hypothetical protein Q9207_006348 [Kuettlingeria erythrocarpa]
MFLAKILELPITLAPHPKDVRSDVAAPCELRENWFFSLSVCLISMQEMIKGTAYVVSVPNFVGTDARRLAITRANAIQDGDRNEILWKYVVDHRLPPHGDADDFRPSAMKPEDIPLGVYTHLNYAFSPYANIDCQEFPSLRFNSAGSVLSE